MVFLCLDLKDEGSFPAGCHRRSGIWCWTISWLRWTDGTISANFENFPKVNHQRLHHSFIVPSFSFPSQLFDWSELTSDPGWRNLEVLVLPGVRLVVLLDAEYGVKNLEPAISFVLVFPWLSRHHFCDFVASVLLISSCYFVSLIPSSSHVCYLVFVSLGGMSAVGIVSRRLLGRRTLQWHW